MRAGPVSVQTPHFQMSQSTFVVGAIGIAWILWLAAQNKLVVYWNLLIGGGAGTSGSSSSGSTTTAPPAGPQSGTPAPAGQAPFTGGLL